MIDVQCPSCSKAYRVGDDKAGKQFRCRECQTIVSIPAAAADDFDLGGEFDDYGADDYSADEYGAPPTHRDAFDEAFSPQPAAGQRRPRVRRRPPARKSGSNTGIIIGAIVGGVFVLALVIGGVIFAVNNVGGSSYAKHEKLAQEAIDQMEELADAFESVRDRDSARAAAVRINTICDNLESMTKKVKSLPKLSRRDDRRLRDKFDPKLEAISARLKSVAFRAGMKSRGEPSFVASLKRLERVGEKMKKAGRGGF